jgi:hypothetical protein
MFDGNSQGVDESFLMNIGLQYADISGTTREGIVILTNETGSPDVPYSGYFNFLYSTSSSGGC